MIVLVFLNDDDGNHYSLGAIAVEDASDEDTLISDAHHEWSQQRGEDDEDADFLEWLFQNKPWATRPTQPVTYVEL